MDHSSSRRLAASSKPADDFYLYLRSLQTRAMDISQTISKLQLRERAPHWPRLLSQFAVLTSQLQTLYEELLTTERSWSGRLHSSLSLFHPLSPHYNPATALRIKPVLEIEELERSCFEQFAKDEALEEYSARELRDQINDFNAAALKLARWNTQASAIPLPREPPVFAATAAAASAASYRSGGVAAPASSPAAAAASASPAAPVRRREDIDRSEDAELQRTLASMFTGRQTKLEPPVQQTQQPMQQQHHPQPAPVPMHPQQQQSQQQQPHAPQYAQQQQQQLHVSQQQQFASAQPMTAQQQQYALQQQHLQQQQRQQQQAQQQHQQHQQQQQQQFR